MKRREFLTMLCSALTALPQAAPAQQAHKVVHGLRDLGYIEGQNLVLERRSAEGRFERIPEIVADLLALKLDAIILGGRNELVLEFKRATSTVPIINLSAISSSLAISAASTSPSTVISLSNRSILPDCSSAT